MREEGRRKERERGRGENQGKVGDKIWEGGEGLREEGETHRTPLCESCIWSRAMRYIFIA